MEELVGDKAFGGEPQRRACEKLGAKLISPPKVNAKDPIPLDEEAYRQRNRIERLFAKLKEFRRVATRYEKLKETFLGLLHLILGFIRLRSISNVNRPYMMSPGRGILPGAGRPRSFAVAYPRPGGPGLLGRRRWRPPAP